MKHKISVLILAVALCIGTFETGCAHRVPLSTQQTIQLNSNQALAAVAASNKTATDLTIQLNAQKIIADDLTRSILGYTSAVASGVTAAVAVQQGTKSDAEKAQAVLDLLTKIQLPKQVGDFVNSPGASGQIATLITFIKATISGIAALVSGGK